MTYEFEGKTEKDAIDTARKELGLSQDSFDVEILETQKNSLFKKGYTKIRVHLDDGTEEPSRKKAPKQRTQNRVSNAQTQQNIIPPQTDFEKDLVDFVQTVIEKMGYRAKVSISSREEKKIGLKIESEDSSILIGRKGKNLDALQLLANVKAGKLGYEDTKVILDTQNYRIRREESLVRLAYNMADKVRYSKRSVLLEPMNPYERRIVHTTLNDANDVETKSEGEGLYKQVRIFYTGEK